MRKKILYKIHFQIGIISIFFPLYSIVSSSSIMDVHRLFLPIRASFNKDSESAKVIKEAISENLRKYVDKF